MIRVGYRMSPEAKEKMRAAKLGKKLGPQSDEHKAKIAAANRGRVAPRIHERTCPCGTTFKSGSHVAKFCSVKCRRAAKGHGLRHAPQFAHFTQQCAICGSGEDLVGDHDHDTGKPRGILCRKCNLAIGNMLDNPQLLRAAAEYLERSRSKEPHGVYLSGPMSGLPLNNFPAFHAAAASLRASGYTVINPAELDVADQAPMSWDQYLRRDIKVLVDCTHIALLPGWERSRGARLEKYLAEALGMRPIFVNVKGTVPA